MFLSMPGAVGVEADLYSGALAAKMNGLVRTDGKDGLI
jgi:hypothetical protein